MPELLSPHGEGYCRTCRFVEGLDASGALEKHERSKPATFGLEREACPGSGRRPRPIPFSSRLAAFRTTPPRVTCPGCGRERVRVLRNGVGDRPWMERHPRTGGIGYCDWSFRDPAS